MKSNNYEKGFTLVELLIVIAILGVLAGVVLVAINPLEQVKRGKDSSRISAVSQLGGAMVRYATVQNAGAYPASTASWQTSILVSINELRLPIVAPSSTTACGVAINLDNGYCYSPLNSSSDFAIWSNLESSAEAGKLTSCTSPKQPAAVYFGSKGKVQLDCLPVSTAIPLTTDTVVNP